jgi:hypothetical protein
MSNGNHLAEELLEWITDSGAEHLAELIGFGAIEHFYDWLVDECAVPDEGSREEVLAAYRAYWLGEQDEIS